MPEERNGPGLRQLPLRGRHERAGARFAPFAGWEMPLQYAGVIAEHRAVRSACGIFDVSHMGRVEVRRPGAGERIRTAVTSDVRGLEPGRARYTLYCEDDGGIADDLMVYRVSEDRWLLVHNAANAEADLARIQRLAGDAVRDVSAETVMLAVQGPEAPTILERVLGSAIAGLRPRRCRELLWEDASVLFARTGYTGEAGGECVTDAATGARLWDALLGAGCAPAGLGARDTLRLEAGLPLHGQDITPATTPYEAGLDWTISLDDGEPFIGREALDDLAGHPPDRRLACLRLRDRGVPRTGYRVLDPASGEHVGTVTSGAHSPTLGVGIAMAYVPPPLAVPGAPLAVEIRDRAVPAEAVARPFYHRSNR